METVKIKCPHCDTFITASQKEVYAGLRCSACKQMIYAADLMVEMTPGAQAATTHSGFIGQQLPYIFNNITKVYLSMVYLAQKKYRYKRLRNLWQQLSFYIDSLFEDSKEVRDYQAFLVNMNYQIIAEILQRLDTVPEALAEIKDEWANDVKRFENERENDPRFSQ